MDIKPSHHLCLMFLILLAVSYGSNAAKILIIPTPHGSHIHPLLQVTETLRDKYGHSTTFVLPQYMMKSSLVKGMKHKVIIAEKLEDYNMQELAQTVINSTYDGTFPARELLKTFTGICDPILSDDVLMEKLKKERFDILIIHNAFISDCLNFAAYKLSIPFVHYGNFYEPISSGLPHNPATVPDFPFMTDGSDMNFVQRLKSTFLYFVKPLIFSMAFSSDLSTKYVPEKPFISIRELRSRLELNLLEFDVLLDYPRPSLPHIKYVGGLNTAPAKPLNKRLSAYMDAAQGGVVIVSFGSLVNKMPQDKANILFSAMKKIPELKFVMRYGDKEKEDENLLLLPWIPQNDLLGHAKTRAFITHCGNSGQFEALYHGVPMIGVTISGDQPYNAGRMVARGYGRSTGIAAIEENSLSELIREVVFNSTYKKNILKASQIFKSRESIPSERAAYWVDNVIQFGGEYMRSRGSSLPLFVYFSLDVYAFFFICVVVILYIVKAILAFLVRCICQSRQRQKEKTN